MNKGKGKGVGRLECLPLARPFFLSPNTSNFTSPPPHPPLGGEGEEWLGSGGCAKKSEQEKRAMVIVCLLFSHRDTALNIIITIPRDVVSNRRKRAVYRKRKMRLWAKIKTQHKGQSN